MDQDVKLKLIINIVLAKLSQRGGYYSLSPVNHRLNNLEPINLNQSGFQANPLFARMIIFVDRENV